MNSKLKRDQIPQQEANNWRKSFKEEEKLTFNLKVSQIIIQKETYKILAGENQNRVRVYLGLEPGNENGEQVLCVFAVSAFLEGSNDVYVDYETPVFKLSAVNEDFSSKTKDVIESIRRYRKWRNGESGAGNESAVVRKYIYPNAYLLTKSELYEIFNTQNKKVAQIEFGISKSMHVMIMPEVVIKRSIEDDSDVYDWGQLCPPLCDENSIYNS